MTTQLAHPVVVTWTGERECTYTEDGSGDCDGWLDAGYLFVPTDGQQEPGTYIQEYDPSIAEQADGTIDDGWLRVDAWLIDTRAGWYALKSGKPALILPTGPTILA